jgi:hypothetical protein
LLNSHSHLTYGNIADKPSLESLIVSLTKNV